MRPPGAMYPTGDGSSGPKESWAGPRSKQQGHLCEARRVTLSVPFPSIREALVLSLPPSSKPPVSEVLFPSSCPDSFAKTHRARTGKESFIVPKC